MVMGRRRSRALLAAILVVVLGAGLILLASFWLSGVWAAALKYVGGVVSAVGGLVGMGEKVWRWFRPADSRPVDTLADLLAEAVYRQWHKEATERLLVTPAPIPISPHVPGGGAARA
jgi:hypothetical protein